MGQRLNIEIENNEKVLANSYYHWSAYTDCSIVLTKIILDNFNKVENNMSDLEKAIFLLKTTGATFSTDEKAKAELIDDIKKYALNTDTIDRNNGLISFTENGINDSRYWEEGRVTINIESKTIDFNVIDTITKEEYEEDYNSIKPITKTLKHDITNINFDEFDDFVKNFNLGEYEFLYLDSTKENIIVTIQ